MTVYIFAVGFYWPEIRKRSSLHVYNESLCTEYMGSQIKERLWLAYGSIVSCPFLGWNWIFEFCRITHSHYCERELSWAVPSLSLPNAGGPLRGALRLQQAMCGASDTRERAHDARQRFLASIVLAREVANLYSNEGYWFARGFKVLRVSLSDNKFKCRTPELIFRVQMTVTEARASINGKL